MPGLEEPVLRIIRERDADIGLTLAMLIYVDDATSRLRLLLFVSSESASTYFEATRGYLVRYGKIRAYLHIKIPIRQTSFTQLIGVAMKHT